jgi:hypothetical protein
VHGGPQVDDEGEDVGGEDEGDDPLEDGSGVTLLDARADGEGDDEGEFEEDKAEFYVEGGAKDPVFSVVWLTSQGICPKCSNVRELQRNGSGNGGNLLLLSLRYSRHMKMALIRYPPIKRPRKMLCRRW